MTSLLLILQNAALCVVFGLSLFARVVANAIYAANNTVSITLYDICDQSTDITNDICDALRRLRESEAAAAVSCEINHMITTYMHTIYVHLTRKVSIHCKIKNEQLVSTPSKLNPSNVHLAIIILNTCA